ncbi:MAG: ribose-phosphate diphosphokinase [Bacteroidetes bacterium]|nr:MAG: ribose-phosphate diphosphokinase [Bacteroidota bacterium]
MKNKDQFIVFSTEKYNYLKKNLLAEGNYESGELTRKTFPDGEKYYQILSNVQYKEVVLIGGTISDQETLELYDLATGLVEYGARKLNLILPYYGYSTMERSVKKGEIVTAKTRARLISAIPQAYFGNRVILLDLHSEGITNYFEGAIRPLHLYAKPLIIEAAKELAGENFVLASTDAGRAKWVESLAYDMHVDAAFVYKRRLSGSNTQVTGINADVKNRNVVIYDDMIRTGGSLLHAAKAYADAGAKKIFVIATHGIFPNNALQKIKDSGLVEQMMVTDSHPNVLELEGDFLKVKPIHFLLKDALESLGEIE